MYRFHNINKKLFLTPRYKITSGFSASSKRLLRIAFQLSQISHKTAFLVNGSSATSPSIHGSNIQIMRIKVVKAIQLFVLFFQLKMLLKLMESISTDKNSQCYFISRNTHSMFKGSKAFINRSMLFLSVANLNLGSNFSSYLICRGEKVTTKARNLKNVE